MNREEAGKKLADAIARAEYVDDQYIDLLQLEAVKIAYTALNEPEVVRCKDCKWFVTACYSKYPEDRYCSYDNSNFSTDPEGFCYRGDRRDDMIEVNDIPRSDAPTQLTAVIRRASDYEQAEERSFSSISELMTFMEEVGSIIIYPNTSRYIQLGLQLPYDIIIYDDYVE